MSNVSLHRRRMSGNITSGAFEHWPGHVSHSKVTASAVGLRLLDQAVVEEDAGGEQILPKSAVSGTVIGKRQHTFENYGNSNVDLPDVSPYAADVEDRLNREGNEEDQPVGELVRKKREVNIFSKCCTIL